MMKLRKIKANFWIVLGHLWLLPVTILTIISVILLHIATSFLGVAIPAHKRDFVEGRKEILSTMQPFLSSVWCDLLSGCLWFILFLWLILRN